MRALTRGASQEGDNAFSCLNRVTKAVDKFVSLEREGGNVLYMINGPCHYSYQIHQLRARKVDHDYYRRFT